MRHIPRDKLFELRIRADKPLYANIAGRFSPLGESGVAPSCKTALIPTANEVEETLYAACGYSLYAVENQLRQGFLTTAQGVRIGIAGTYVYEHGSVHTIRAVTSLCIRLPHEVAGCARKIYDRCLHDGLHSLLLLSPPGMGKTTLLRDLSRMICEMTQENVLVCDERGELSAGDTGITSDRVCFCDKLTAFTAGIRAMRPTVIVTDELLPADYAAVKRAMEGGIIVMASAHLTDYEQVPEKIFSQYILLKGIGEVDKVWDEYGAELD